MTYSGVDENHGVVQVEGEVFSLEGYMCGMHTNYRDEYVVTELKTGAFLARETNRVDSILNAKSRIRSTEFGPAMVRTKATLTNMGIEYPVNKIHETLK